MPSLDQFQRVNVERVRKAKKISIVIDDGEKLELVAKGDISTLRHDIAIALQSHYNKLNVRAEAIYTR